MSFPNSKQYYLGIAIIVDDEITSIHEISVPMEPEVEENIKSLLASVMHQLLGR